MTDMAIEGQKMIKIRGRDEWVIVNSGGIVRKIKGVAELEMYAREIGVLKSWEELERK